MASINNSTGAGTVDCSSDVDADFKRTDMELADSVLNSSGIAKYMPETGHWELDAKFRQNDAFTIAPITITEGPLKGCQAFVTMPYRPFRFLDLPAELRAMVLEAVLTKNDSFSIVSFKAPGRARRPVQSLYHLRKGHEGLSWDKKLAKWVGLPPSNFAITQVNKEVSQQALPIGYGANTFSFDATGDMAHFFDTIGSMRKYVRHVEMPCIGMYTGGRGRGLRAFSSLLPAMNLRSLKINHRLLCSTNGRESKLVSLQDFVGDVLPFLRALYASLLGRNLSYNVLDIVKVIPEAWTCPTCKSGLAQCTYAADPKGSCSVPCEDTTQRKHCEELNAKLKALLVEELQIELDENGKYVC